MRKIRWILSGCACLIILACVIFTGVAHSYFGAPESKIMLSLSMGCFLISLCLKIYETKKRGRIDYAAIGMLVGLTVAWIFCLCM